MTETPTTTDTIDPTGMPEQVVHRNARLYQVLAWVGIVAGILFIVGAVFFSGFFVARAGSGYGWHRGYQSGQMPTNGPMGAGCPMMQKQPGGMGSGGMGGMGPGGMGGMGPGGMAPGGATGSAPTSMPSMPSMPSAGQR